MGFYAPTAASVSVAAANTIADAVWDEDIAAAHGTAATAGLMLRALGSAISLRSNNATLNALLGVTDAASTDVIDMVWNELMSGHTTPGSFSWGAVRHAVKTIAFTGAANLGEVGNVPLFTITGNILVLRLVARCTEDLVGATATLALGVTGETARFIAATTATDIDSGEFWEDATPGATGEALPAALMDQPIDNNIVGTVAVANITDGTIEVNVFYLPLSSDGALAAA